MDAAENGWRLHSGVVLKVSREENPLKGRGCEW